MPVIHAPHIARELNIGDRDLFTHTNSMASRRRPYLPSLRSTAARIIDPATGASTCALGSQRWTVNSGIFTINAAIVINHHKEEM